MSVFDSISGSFGFSLLFLFVTQLQILPTFMCGVQVTVDYSDDVATIVLAGFRIYMASDYPHVCRTDLCHLR